MDDHLIDIAQKLGEISGKLDGIDTRLDDLTGDNGRIAALEKDKVRQFWVTVAVIPVIGILHAIARKIGLDV